MKTKIPQLERLFEKLEEGVLIVDREWGILYANDFARRSLGLGVEDHLRQELISKLEGRFLSEMDIGNVIAGSGAGEEWSITFDAISQRHEGHEPFTLSIYMSRPSDDGTRFILLRDVTEERREELSKEKFLSLISHKLITPISVVALSLSSLRDGICGPLTDKQLGSVEVASEKVRLLERSVRKLIDFAALCRLGHAGAIGRIDAAQVVKAYGERFARRPVTKRAIVTFEREAADATIVAGRAMLESALEALLDNAVKFHPGPEVNITARVFRDTASGRMEISIQDDGPGISPVLQREVFDAFVQRDDDFTGNIEGFGLGLPYVGHLMKLLGGEVRLVSEENRGTTVTLVFPKATMDH